MQAYLILYLANKLTVCNYKRPKVWKINLNERQKAGKQFDRYSKEISG